MAAMEIDGSMGEGGGQVLRTALTLSMCLTQPIAVTNIRSGRKKSGLLRQHLAALKAAAEISDAELEGAELGSTEIRFLPGVVKSGSYEFKIGSAGSTTLLAQTIIPALSMLKEQSSVTVHGGTHNGMAPSVEFVELALVPLLKRAGLGMDSDLLRYGFYPNGGGTWKATVEPWTNARFVELIVRGKPVSREAVATISNLQSHIGERELERVAKKLAWTNEELVLKEVSAPGPGNLLSLRCVYENVTEVFESVGSIGLSAERVAGRAIRDAKQYVQGRHVVGEYLADQLLLPLVLGAGGVFTTGALSSHCRTNMALINQMLGADYFEIVEEMTEVGPHSTIRIPKGLALAR